jgi:hypothetical protein
MIVLSRMGCDMRVSVLLKFIIPLRYLVRPQAHDLRWYSKGRSAGKDVTTEFTLLGSLDVQVSKMGGCSKSVGDKYKIEKIKNSNNFFVFFLGFIK